jgi:hypothetical protein
MNNFTRMVIHVWLWSLTAILSAVLILGIGVASTAFFYRVAVAWGMLP